MRKAIIISLIAISVIFAQEKTTSTGTNVPLVYAANQVRVLGDLDDGRPGQSFSYAKTPAYRAFVFSAYGGEKVDIKVNSTGPKPFIALTDSTLQQLSQGTNHMTMTLPNHGPYIEVWYVVFRDLNNKAAKYTVSVKRLANAQQVVRADD